jgi:protein gp37
MGDLFHEAISDEYIERCFRVMAGKPGQYAVLTKRSERLYDMMRSELEIAENIHIGVSVENYETYFPRVMDLIDSLSVVDVFGNKPNSILSIEPLLEEIQMAALQLEDLKRASDTVTIIVGCESGADRREPPPLAEAIKIKRLCDEAGCDFILKQWCKPRSKKEAQQLKLLGKHKKGGIKLL